MTLDGGAVFWVLDLGWQPMRIAIFQGPAKSGPPDANLELLARIAHQAAEAGAQLLICAEMFLSGYNIGAEAARRLAEPCDGPSFQRASAIAQNTGIGLIYGYPELGEDGVVYNAAVFLAADGARLANYRKCHLFGALDRAMFAAGDQPVVIAEFGGITIGLLICYDVEFPEAVRLLAQAGADFLVVPTAQMAEFTYVAERMIGVRAFENQMFVAYANRCGAEGDLVYCGSSVVAGPDGHDLARAGADEELIIAEIDPARLAVSRRANPYLLDRRPELYGPIGVSRSVND